MSEKNTTEWVIHTLNELITSLGLESRYGKNPPIETFEDIKMRDLLEIFRILCNLPNPGELSGDAGIPEIEGMISYIRKRYGSKGNEFRYLSPYLIAGKDPDQLKFLLQMFELLHDHQLISQKSSRGNTTSTSLTTLTNSSGHTVTVLHSSVSNPNPTDQSSNNSTRKSNSSADSTINKVRIKVVDGATASPGRESSKSTSPSSISDSSSTINKVKVNIANGTATSNPNSSNGSSSSADDSESSMASASSGTGIEFDIDKIIQTVIEEALSKIKANRQPSKVTYNYKVPKAPERLTSSKLKFDKEQMLMVRTDGPKNDTLLSVSPINTSGQAKPVRVESFSNQTETVIGHIEQSKPGAPDPRRSRENLNFSRAGYTPTDHRPLNSSRIEPGAPDPRSIAISDSSGSAASTINKVKINIVDGSTLTNTDSFHASSLTKEPDSTMAKTSSMSRINATDQSKPIQAEPFNKQPDRHETSETGHVLQGSMHDLSIRKTSNNKILEESKDSEKPLSPHKMVYYKRPSRQLFGINSQKPTVSTLSSPLPVISIEDTHSEKPSSEKSETIAEIRVVQELSNNEDDDSQNTKKPSREKLYDNQKSADLCAFSKMPKKPRKKIFPYYPYGIIIPKCKCISIKGKPKPKLRKIEESEEPHDEDEVDKVIEDWYESLKADVTDSNVSTSKEDQGQGSDSVSKKSLFEQFFQPPVGEKKASTNTVSVNVSASSTRNPESVPPSVQVSKYPSLYPDYVSNSLERQKTLYEAEISRINLMNQNRVSRKIRSSNVNKKSSDIGNKRRGSLSKAALQKEQRAQTVYAEAAARLVELQKSYATEISNIKSKYSTLQENASSESKVNLKAAVEESKAKMLGEIEKLYDYLKTFGQKGRSQLKYYLTTLILFKMLLLVHFLN